MVKLQHAQIGEVEAIDLDYESPNEEWRDYELEDGTTLKVKTVVNKVFKLKDVYNDLGEPVYQISTQNMVRATGVPEDQMGEANLEELPGGGGVPFSEPEDTKEDNEGDDE